MNLHVRYGEGVDGPVILAAWCLTCRQESMPNNRGECMFCDRPIVGAPGVKKRPKPKQRVSDNDIAQALRLEAARLGRTPYSREWRRLNRRPSGETIFRRFGTWSAALTAAGLDSKEDSGG